MIATLRGCFHFISTVVRSLKKMPFKAGHTCAERKRQPNQFRADFEPVGDDANDPRRDHKPACDYQGNWKSSHCLPFPGEAGTKKAPTDALRLVGAISLSAVVGGLHPHQR